MVPHHSVMAAVEMAGNFLCWKGIGGNLGIHQLGNNRQNVANAHTNIMLQLEEKDHINKEQSS